MTLAHGHELIRTNADFEKAYFNKVSRISETEALERGPAHAMNDITTSATHELMHVQDYFSVDEDWRGWSETVKPNLPWAEDHFQERISGEPLNPSPSEAWWPFARRGNEEHKAEDQTFSHTYPERFWPRFANLGGKMKHSERVVASPIVGIRFEYGDLGDLIEVLRRNPRSRQAYLPIWFPEDINAACHGERVPCSMGYHFIYCADCQGMDMIYTMRSCDIVRFYRDDVYMAGRLLQFVSTAIGQKPRTMQINVANLHCFPGDLPLLKELTRQHSSKVKVELNAKTDYNFGAMY